MEYECKSCTARCMQHTVCFKLILRITASPTADHDGHISREVASTPDTPEEVVYTMGNETETSDLEKSQSEGSIRSIRSPSILSSRRTKTPFEVVEIVIGNGIKNHPVVHKRNKISISEDN